MSKNVEQLVEDLSKLTVLEISNLKTLLEEKWGVKASAAAPIMMAAAAPTAQQAAPAAGEKESTEFIVTLQEADASKKITIIKVIREITGLGLKEAKEMVEGAPQVVKPNATKAQAEEMKKKLEDAGAKVTIKGV